MSRKGRIYYPARYTRFKAAARKLLPGCCFEAGIHKPLTGPLVVYLDMAIGRPKRTKLNYPKPDVDNLAKAALDCGNNFIWEDDYQIVVLDSRKRWSDPGVEGSITFTIDPIKL
tara:strand:- start:10468 stop:10809 length:342 start_codon:yes stop_codon:yes gene_type:complete